MQASPNAPESSHSCARALTAAIAASASSGGRGAAPAVPKPATRWSRRIEPNRPAQGRVHDAGTGTAHQADPRGSHCGADEGRGGSSPRPRRASLRRPKTQSSPTSAGARSVHHRRRQGSADPAQAPHRRPAPLAPRALARPAHHRRQTSPGEGRARAFKAGCTPAMAGCGLGLSPKGFRRSALRPSRGRSRWRLDPLLCGVTCS
jgi:hypothetical protein